MDWRRILSYITGTVDEELRLRNEYLAAENRILRSKIPGRVPLDDSDRATLAQIGKRLRLKALGEIAAIVKPETILGWHRKLVAKKFDGSANRKPGRPRTSRRIEDLVVHLALENRSWGYDRIAGALANLGHEISDQTVGNLLLFIHLATRKVEIGGITEHPNGDWTKQVARNVTMVDWGFSATTKHLLHDRDAKFCRAFRTTLKEAGVTALALPPRSPNLNVFAERWIRSAKEECLDRLIFFGAGSLTRALDNYVIHHQRERNHQGLKNVIPFPSPDDRIGCVEGEIVRRERLGGLLSFYHREAG